MSTRGAGLLGSLRRASGLALLVLIGTLIFCEARICEASEGSQTGRMADIPAGTYLQFFPEKTPVSPGEPPRFERVPTKVDAFSIDVHPVTNAEYLEFLRANPRWRKSLVKPLFADRSYLKHWKADLQLADPRAARSPVTNVSWFAASAYCRWRGKELPTVDQWEYAADDRGRGADEIRKRLLRWYSEPNPAVLPQVGSTPRNGFGVADLHGLVWEWTLDFNSALVTDESREDAGNDRNLFCGGGGLGARDASDYPTFQRYAFRASLKANYTVANLGFRCIRGAKK